MSQEQSSDMDELAKSTIMLVLSKSVYFNIKVMTKSYQFWQFLIDLYEKKSVVSQIYWLKKLVEQKIKNEVAMSTHLHEFKSIFGQLNGHKTEFDISLKDLSLLITLPPESWDTFRITISNCAIVVDGQPWQKEIY